MRVGDIMHRDVKTAEAGQTFAEAARILRQNRISSVLVVREGRLAGIVTERDFVNVVADGLDPAETSVGERMTRELVTVEARAEVADAARLMGERGIRHLPVIDRGRLAGIVSIRDLLAFAAQEITGGHELPDLEAGAAALGAAVSLQRPH